VDLYDIILDAYVQRGVANLFVFILFMGSLAFISIFRVPFAEKAEKAQLHSFFAGQASQAPLMSAADAAQWFLSLGTAIFGNMTAQGMFTDGTKVRARSG
jgi:hypothetical protein